MDDEFLLDPDYKDFDFTDKEKLKFLTVSGEQHGAFGGAIFILIGYSAFAQLRATRSTRTGRSDVTLTPREREVMQLSAEGLTSAEIAEKLGMSARTANQHVDNVADKLGTRNRAHTVAESVRRGLL